MIISRLFVVSTFFYKLVDRDLCNLRKRRITFVFVCVHTCVVTVHDWKYQAKPHSTEMIMECVKVARLLQGFDNQYCMIHCSAGVRLQFSNTQHFRGIMPTPQTNHLLRGRSKSGGPRSTVASRWAASGRHPIMLSSLTFSLWA